MATVRAIIEQFFSQFEAGYETLNLIELSRSAMLNNFDYLKRIHRAEYVIPVLKSNAYGHGYEILKILEAREVPYVAVDGYNEALEVKALSDFNVLVMGAVLPENFSKIETRRIVYVIQDLSSLNVLSNMRRDIRIHLEFNTGMNRQGFEPDEVNNVIKMLKDNDHIELEGIMSHFYDVNKPDQKSIKKQIKDFDEIVAKIKKAGFRPKYIHISKTAAITNASSKYANTIRPGIGLFGINPVSEDHPYYEQFDDLEPVMKATSRVVKIRHLPKGSGVSYEHTYKAKSDIDIAVIPFGYDEGLDDRLANKGFVRFKGQDLPIIGKICMNHAIVDVTGLNVRVWDKIEVFSRDHHATNSLQRIWKEHGLNPYVMLAHLSSDIRRVVVS